MSNSFLAIRDILNEKQLWEDQRADVVKCWMTGRSIISCDTGMGKTVRASAIIKGLVNEVPSRKFIFVMGNNQIGQTDVEVAEDTGLKVAVCTGELQSQIENLLQKDFNDYSILFLTFSFFDRIESVWYLFRNYHRFHGVIIDEAHLISNFHNSARSLALRGLLRNFKFVIAMTATPAKTDVKQVVNLLHMVIPEEVTHLDEVTFGLTNGKYSLQEEFGDFYINRTRSSLTSYLTHLTFTKPTPAQIEAKGNSASIVYKGEGAWDNLQALKDRLDYHVGQGLKGLVYIRHRKVMDWVVQELAKDGYKFEYINGQVTNLQKKNEKYNAFYEDEVDFLLTSITTSKNLECDFLIVYEACPDLTQFLGRGHRTMNPKTLRLDFIFTEDTMEIIYFMDKFYPRSMALQSVLKKDYSVISDVVEKAKRTLKLR